MESSLAALYDPASRKDTSLFAQNYLAESSVEHEREAIEQGEEDEEDEEEDDEEEDQDNGSVGAEEHVSNKEIEEPTCNVQKPSIIGQCEPHQQAQRCAKRSRASTAKERISKMPPCAAGKRSSIYRGVTRHRWTGRYEAHLWDKSTWNQTQNKKGKQVYLGAYDDEEAAARAYDLAALKYWGPGTLINFPVSDYARDIDEMQSVSREDYLASLRRKSSGFSRTSKMKGVGRSHSNARWDIQAGSFMSTLPMIGGYDTLRDGPGRPSLEFGVLGCPPAGMINLCHFMNWLQPPNLSCEVQLNVPKKSSKFMEEDHSSEEHSSQRSSTCGEEYSNAINGQEERYRGNELSQCHVPYQLPFLGLHNGDSKSGISALSALSHSSMFARMEQGLNATMGLETAERRVVESATGALAAALAMEDSVQSPEVGRACFSYQSIGDANVQSPEVERACFSYQNNGHANVDVSNLRADADVHVLSLRGEASALAAALGMDDCVRSPQEVESASCFIGHADVHYASLQEEVHSNDYSHDYGHAHSLLTLPVPHVPYMMDQTANPSDNMLGLWNAFEPPSSISMGMIF